jgi:hypothetical protein
MGHSMPLIEKLDPFLFPLGGLFRNLFGLRPVRCESLQQALSLALGRPHRSSHFPVGGSLGDHPNDSCPEHINERLDLSARLVIESCEAVGLNGRGYRLGPSVVCSRGFCG